MVDEVNSTGQKVLYRVEGQSNVHFDEDGRPSGFLSSTFRTVTVTIFVYKVVRETERSWLIQDGAIKPRRVPKVGRKLFAWPTKEKAIQSFKVRKQRQLQHLARLKAEVEHQLAVPEQNFQEVRLFNPPV